MIFENVVRISQWGGGQGAGAIPLFILSTDAFTLAGKVEIARRTPEHKTGYQRALFTHRLGKGKLGVGGYLLKQMGIFPTSVLLNVRKEDGEVKFVKKSSVDDNIDTGDLEVPDDLTWYVVDGQHRLEGLKSAMAEKREFQKYPVVVTLTNQDMLYEMLIFFMVNDRAKSVPTDLAYRILQRAVYDPAAPGWAREIFGSGAEGRKAIAATIVDILNADNASPFKGKIQEVGEVKKPEHLVRDGQLIKYVSFILKEATFDGMLDTEVAKFLASYWTAIQRVWPKTFDNPEDYLLLQTIGLSSLSRLFPAVYGYTARDGKVSRTNMEKYLRYLRERTPDHDDPDFQGRIEEKWWHRVDGPGIIHGTGEGHYQRVYRGLAKKIGLAVEKHEGKGVA